MLKTKKCSTCKQLLPAKSFSKRKASNDGFAYVCKKCLKEYKSKNKHRLKTWSTEEWVIYRKNHKPEITINNKRYRDKNRAEICKAGSEYHAKNKEIINKRKTEYKKKNKDQIFKYQAEYRKNNKKKTSAHHILNIAVKKGNIERSEKCHCCKSNEKIIGHHEDYSKPLEVNWVCHKCHMEIHHGITQQAEEKRQLIKWRI